MMSHYSWLPLPQCLHVQTVSECYDGGSASRNASDLAMSQMTLHLNKNTNENNYERDGTSDTLNRAYKETQPPTPTPISTSTKMMIFYWMCCHVCDATCSSNLICSAPIYSYLSYRQCQLSRRISLSLTTPTCS